MAEIGAIAAGSDPEDDYADGDSNPRDYADDDFDLGNEDDFCQAVEAFEASEDPVPDHMKAIVHSYKKRLATLPRCHRRRLHRLHPADFVLLDHLVEHHGLKSAFKEATERAPVARLLGEMLDHLDRLAVRLRLGVPTLVAPDAPWQDSDPAGERWPPVLTLLADALTRHGPPAAPHDGGATWRSAQSMEVTAA